MADRYSDRYPGDPYTTGRAFAPDDRNFIERAGDEVRSWFGHDEAERRRRMDEHERDRDRDRWPRRSPGEGGNPSMHGYGYAGGREEYRSRRDYSSMPERSSERDWTPERWERTDRWSGERPMAYAPETSPSRAWHERDDRYVAPGDYRHWTGSPSTGPRGIYEDDRGRVHQFEHGTENFVGRGPKGYRRSDERIFEDVCERLTEDWRIDASDVEVVVNNGEVTLSGVVNSRGAKRHAEDILEDVSGVRDVRNNLRVTTSE